MLAEGLFNAWLYIGLCSCGLSVGVCWIGGEIEVAEQPASSAQAVQWDWNGPLKRIDARVEGSEVVVRPGDYLLDPAVTYPVVIDPSNEKSGAFMLSLRVGSGGFADMGVSEGWVGKQGWPGTVDHSVWRTYYSFNFPVGVAGASVSSARFEMLQTHSPQFACQRDYGPTVQLHLSDGFDARTRWPGPSTYDAFASSAYGSGSSDRCAPTWQRWDVTGQIQNYAGRGLGGINFGVVSANEGDRDGWRRYAHSPSPQLVISFNRAPNSPSNGTYVGARYEPSNGYFYSSKDRVLVAADVSDPDDDRVLVAADVSDPDDDRVLVAAVFFCWD